MNNILCVGFGGMGCRHTQSMLSLGDGFNHFILEPDLEIFQQNIARIGSSPEEVTHLLSTATVPNNIDFAIIATSAGPRFTILKDLIGKGIKSFLLEKIVFQSANQFSEICELLEANQATAYCNFVNRYFPNYIRIKEKVKGANPISFVVSGNDFGLGCNSLHYIDLFEYLTDSKVELVNSDLSINPVENKRGAAYREVLGHLTFKTDKGDSCIIIADDKQTGGVTIAINNVDFTEVLNEQTLKHYSFEKGVNAKVGEFEIIYTSSLTAQIYQDIKAGTVLLPSVQETENAHLQLFKAINPAFGLTKDELCPIT